MSLMVRPRAARQQLAARKRSLPSRRIVALAAMLAAIALVPLISVASAAAANGAPGGSGGGGGKGGGGGASGKAPAIPNNLSFPVIWAGGQALAIPGAFEHPVLVKSVPYTVPGTDPPQVIPVYPQGDAENSWQAGNVAAFTPVEVSEIDWGDNLEAKSLTLGKPVRVETTLLKSLRAGEEMTKLPMVSLGGEKLEEEFATTGAQTPSAQATIYSACARLTIQRLLVSREDPSLSDLSWDAAAGEWTGEGLVAPAIFNGGAWAGGEGSGYSAEVNAAGTVLYGYNWRTSGLTASDYRITFSFEQSCTNTLITEATKVVFSEEQAAEPTASPGGSGGVSGGGVPQIDATHSLSYVDVRLGTRSSGKRSDVEVTLHKKVVASAKQSSAGGHRGLAAAAAGVVYKLWGTVSPRRDKQKLRIQLRAKQGWRTVAITRLRKADNERSKYSLRLRNPKKGTYRALMVSNNNYHAGISRKVKLRHR